MEQTKIKKKFGIRKTIGLSLLVVLVVIFITGAVHLSIYDTFADDIIPYESEQEVYDFFDAGPDEEFNYSLERYKGKFDEIIEEYNSLADTAVGSPETIEELPVEYDSVVSDANVLIIDYFNEKYSVSVENKINALEVKQVETGEEVGGFHATDIEGFDGNTVYISNREINASTIKEEYYTLEFLSTYIHETVHYLGITCDDQGITYLIEGITEALTEDIFLYGGYDYYNTTLYTTSADLGRQFIIADKEFVEDIIASDKYYTEDEWIQIIDSHSIEGMAQNLDQSLLLTSHKRFNRKYKKLAQYFMGEYCKYFELSREDQLEIADEFLTPISKFTD